MTLEDDIFIYLQDRDEKTRKSSTNQGRREVSGHFTFTFINYLGCATADDFTLGRGEKKVEQKWKGTENDPDLFRVQKFVWGSPGGGGVPGSPTPSKQPIVDS